VEGINSPPHSREGVISMKKYTLSLIFYPQDTGGYTVVCPELDGCFTQGDTFEEAEMCIRELIPEALARETEQEENAELLREGLAMPGKIFREVVFEA
jgi:predicted RNase H-like HicB family nuclease